MKNTIGGDSEQNKRLLKFIFAFLHFELKLTICYRPLFLSRKLRRVFSHLKPCEVLRSCSKSDTLKGVVNLFSLIRELLSLGLEILH